MGCPPLGEAWEQSRSIGTGMLAYEGGAIVELYCGWMFVFWCQLAFGFCQLFQFCWFWFGAWNQPHWSPRCVFLRGPKMFLTTCHDLMLWIAFSLVAS